MSVSQIANTMRLRKARDGRVNRFYLIEIIEDEFFIFDFLRAYQLSVLHVLYAESISPSNLSQIMAAADLTDR